MAGLTLAAAEMAAETGALRLHGDGHPGQRRAPERLAAVRRVRRREPDGQGRVPRAHRAGADSGQQGGVPADQRLVRDPARLLGGGTQFPAGHVPPGAES